MLPSIMLLCLHLRLCSILKNEEEPFGGCNIIVIGDLLQLPPVRGDQVFELVTAKTCRNRIGSFGAVYLWDNFQYDELTKSVRHCADLQFSNTCQRIPVGDATVEDIHLI